MLLSSDKIILRPLRDEDQSILAQYANSKKIADNLRDAFPHPYTIDNAIFFINLSKQEEPIMTFAIEFEGEFCGVIGLTAQKDVYRRTAEIGYWIAEPFWNKGIATEAVKLITDYGLNKLRFVRIHTGIFEYNPSSMRVLEKCGFKKDGVFEKSVTKNGRMWDEHRYSILNHLID